MKRILKYNILIILTLLLAVQCSDDNRQIEGTIEYKISYPCLEKSKNSLMFFLPKKMIMSFKDDCFKNEFIFSNPNSKLEAISNCSSKEITLAFGYGKSLKYTKLDSNTINILLDDLPKYSSLNGKTDSVSFLEKASLNYEIKSSYNDSLFRVTSTSDILINNVNWCTPFNEIKEVMLEYNLIQYGIEMKFEAEKINNIKVKDDFLKLDPKYKYLPIKQYLKEVKSILSIFNCE